VRNFSVNENIELDKDAIRSNSAKHALESICLNTMWVKLTEFNTCVKSRINSYRHELFGFLDTPGIEFMNFVFASYHMVWEPWPFAAEENIPNIRTSY
jgi:hypothetical protein